MKVIITAPAWESYERSLQFMAGYMTDRELERLDKKLWDAIASLSKLPGGGQYESYLDHLGEGHRRLVVGNIKVVYRISSSVIHVTDIFDTRQDPRRMRG